MRCIHRNQCISCAHLLRAVHRTPICELHRSHTLVGALLRLIGCTKIAANRAVLLQLGRALGSAVDFASYGRVRRQRHDVISMTPCRFEKGEDDAATNASTCFLQERRNRCRNSATLNPVRSARSQLDIRVMCVAPIAWFVAVRKPAEETMVQPPGGHGRDPACTTRLLRLLRHPHGLTTIG
jgi:hypothetical protein